MVLVTDAGRVVEIAHRGYAAEAPENTIAALRRAGRRADGVELDVRRCGSGELVVVHDATVDRVTDGTGRVADHSLAELQALDVLDSGESIPRLDAALAAVPDDVMVNVELKETGVAADAVATLQGVANPVLVSSFSETALREVRAVSRSIQTASAALLITSVSLLLGVLVDLVWSPTILPPAKRCHVERSSYPVQLLVRSGLQGVRAMPVLIPLTVRRPLSNTATEMSSSKRVL
jgi:glycerophosphoryl diester phosphodiesterase